MDFGKISYTELDTINFILPPEPESNRLLLSGSRAASPAVYVGCPRWGVKEWVGKLYPKGTGDGRFLYEYTKQFSCIELNSTFYNLYDEAAIAKWAAKASEGFKFCPKIYQGISHEGSLTGKQELTEAFTKSMAAFGSYLGPSFLQLSDRFGPQRMPELADYLRAFPTAFPLFVELRHPDWFLPGNLQALTALLQETGKGLVITDTAGRRDCCHMHLSQAKTMIRFVANNLHSTDYTRIDAWVERCRIWIEAGLQELYFIIHMSHEKHSPELAAYLVEKLNAACRLNLKKPVLLQQELF